MVFIWFDKQQFATPIIKKKGKTKNKIPFDGYKAEF